MCCGLMLAGNYKTDTLENTSLITCTFTCSYCDVLGASSNTLLSPRAEISNLSPKYYIGKIVDS